MQDRIEFAEGNDDGAVPSAPDPNSLLLS